MGPPKKKTAKIPYETLEELSNDKALHKQRENFAKYLEGKSTHLCKTRGKTNHKDCLSLKRRDRRAKGRGGKQPLKLELSFGLSGVGVERKSL